MMSNFKLRNSSSVFRTSCEYVLFIYNVFPWPKLVMNLEESWWTDSSGKSKAVAITSVDPMLPW